MFVPFNDLSRIHKPILSKSISSLKEAVLDNDLILGNDTLNFENNFSKFTKQKYTVSCANGTDAIELILRSLNVGNGDEVLVPANTFIATALAVIRTGAKPIFVDNDKYFLIDPKKVENKIRKNTKAIIGVNLYGQICDLKKLKNIADKNNLYFIEDAAQSHGSRQNNINVGDNSIAAAYSFYPGKNLGGWGDGGAITTNNRNIYKKLLKLRNVGSIEKYVHETIGFNSRLNLINAIVLNNKLKSIHEFNKERNSLAKQYIEAFCDNEKIIVPEVFQKNYHVWHLFVLRVKKRDSFIKNALKEGVQMLIHYPIPIHRQKALSYHHQFNSNISNADKFSKELVSLPIFPGMKKGEINHVISTVNKLVN